MIDICIDLIRSRVRSLPFVKITVDEEQRMCDYLFTLPKETIWAFEKHTETSDGARKILKFLRKTL